MRTQDLSNRVESHSLATLDTATTVAELDTLWKQHQAAGVGDIPTILRPTSGGYLVTETFEDHYRRRRQLLEAAERKDLGTHDTADTAVRAFLECVDRANKVDVALTRARVRRAIKLAKEVRRLADECRELGVVGIKTLRLDPDTGQVSEAFYDDFEAEYDMVYTSLVFGTQSSADPSPNNAWAWEYHAVIASIGERGWEAIRKDGAA